MRTRFLRGTRDQNNGLTLAEGELSIDEETKAVRLHDGTTLGGFEIIGTQAVTGPTQGDLTAGFYGEVPGSELISYGDLSLAVGLSAGTLQHDAESAWLHYSLDGKEVYVAKKPIRHSLNWEHIYQAGCVYGVDGFGSNPSGTNVDQGTVVTIGGQDYRVRLLRGAGADPSVQGADGVWYGWDVDVANGSEWNRLLYPVHSGVHTNANNPTPHTDPNAGAYASWASYSDADLLVNSNHGNGSYSWCQETSGDNTVPRVYRGGIGVSYFHRTTATTTTTSLGWRPVLELIQ